MAGKSGKVRHTVSVPGRGVVREVPSKERAEEVAAEYTGATVAPVKK
jgi:hypothetical protein